MPRAGRFGTISEQVRHSHGWLNASQAKLDGNQERCRDCQHYFLMHSQGRHYCGRMGCVTTALARCRNWRDGLAAFQAQRAQS